METQEKATEQAVSQPIPKPSKIELYKALAKFQGKCPTIDFDSKGYGYGYAGLSKIVKTISPLLAAQGLGFTQIINNNTLETILFHGESGQEITSSIDMPTASLPGMNIYQSFGASSTYYKRYALSAIVGIVTEQDTDGNSTPPQQQKRTHVRTESVKM